MTERQAVIYACPHCRGVTRAEFPDGVISPTQYGERIRAAAVYLDIQQLLPEDRTAQTLSDLIGAPHVCPASLTAWARKKAAHLDGVYRAIEGRVAEAKVRHLDETGFRIAGSPALAAHDLEPRPYVLPGRRGARRHSGRAHGRSGGA